MFTYNLANYTTTSCDLRVVSSSAAEKTGFVDFLRDCSGDKNITYSEWVI